MELVTNMLGLVCKTILFTFSAILIFCGISTEAPAHDGDYDLTIRMPNVVPEEPDALWCTGIELQPEEAYIVKFTPHASKTTAHHMVTYGCKALANTNKTWTCDQSDSLQTEHSLCADGEERQILFAWANDAPEKTLPQDVGLRISGYTDINYIVVQLHYAKKFAEGQTDSSGMTYHITHKRPALQMGYYVLGSAAPVPPKQKEYHLDSSCRFDGDYPMYPIGYRTHSHSIGVVTSGYRIRDGIWTEIGRMSPHMPQTFYNVSNPGMDIRKGDILASRCTMDSTSRMYPTYMGPRHIDEMCNFYIMYSTHNPDNLMTDLCFKSIEYTWADGLPDFLPPPPNVSSLDGIENADYVRDLFKHMNLTANI